MLDNSMFSLEIMVTLPIPKPHASIASWKKKNGSFVVDIWSELGQHARHGEPQD
jgi:hypothetical protein